MRAATLPASLRGFARREDGNAIIFSLHLLVIMVLMTGFAIDVIRTEAARTKLQNTLDRAVLAAADLDQTKPPQEVVNEYFAREGMSQFLVSVTSETGLNYKTVSAESKADVPTRFVGKIAAETLPAIASGAANETITDVEISLVLDNSGSMNSNNRLNLLKAAAKDFIDIVMTNDSSEAQVSINIIPFSTQVSVGPSLMQHFNVSGEHSYSHCVNFNGGDFTQAALSQTSQLQRTGHFDVFSWAKPIRIEYLVCPSDHETVSNPNNRSMSSRHITFMEDNANALKSKIDSMWAGGNTSIDVATKWGLALLDPSIRNIVDTEIAAGNVTADFSGRPFDYTQQQVMKVLVVMSDGENTSQYMLRNQYRSGDSPLFIDNQNGRETYYDDRSGTSYDYYYINGNYWRDTPYYDWNRAEQQTWPEVWATRSVANFARYAKARALGGSWTSYYYDAWTSVHPSTKNTRTSQICTAAKNQGITVYTIGMDTYGQGDATLNDCATSESFFFDVDGLEIGQAFAAIARDINRLRLTH